MHEKAIKFNCQDNELIGIIHHPNSDQNTSIGVLIVVGGPQYRVGSHRQFVLLARDLAKNNIPTMRFDCAGMGDSTGTFSKFTHLNDDIQSAIKVFSTQCPKVKQIILWGLCDAASANMIFVANSNHVAGLILLNPWVRSNHTYAKATIRDHHLKQLLNPQFWKRLFTLDVNIFHSIQGLAATIKSTFFRVREDEEDDFIRTMLIGVRKFSKNMLFILSGNDLTASEFKTLVRTDKEWWQAMDSKNIVTINIKDADHTFSSAEWRTKVSKHTIDWIITNFADSFATNRVDR